MPIVERQDGSTVYLEDAANAEAYARDVQGRVLPEPETVQAPDPGTFVPPPAPVQTPPTGEPDPNATGQE